MATDSAQVASLQKELAETRALVKVLAEKIEHSETNQTTYAASSYACAEPNFNEIPQKGMVCMAGSYATYLSIFLSNID